MVWSRGGEGGGATAGCHSYIWVMGGAGDGPHNHSLAPRHPPLYHPTPHHTAQRSPHTALHHPTMLHTPKNTTLHSSALPPYVALYCPTLPNSPPYRLTSRCTTTPPTAPGSPSYTVSTDVLSFTINIHSYSDDVLQHIHCYSRIRNEERNDDPRD